MHLPIRKRRCARVFFAILSCAGAGGFGPGARGLAADGGIRLSEVLYDSGGRGQLEYLELHNAGSEPVDLVGWSFVDGIRHSFDRSTVIPPKGFLVVARRRSAVEAFFALPPGSIAGDFEGGLDGDGERIELTDAEGRTVEDLTYRDGFPFRGLEPGIEIGESSNFSLQRLCFEVPAGAPFNWRPAAPTPGAAAETLGCPPAPPAPRPDLHPVVINEISYHPSGNLDPLLEYLELFNRTDREVDLSGWSFDKGIGFVFPAGTRLAGGKYLLVAQTPPALVQARGLPVESVLGPFDEGTQLSNSGELVQLVDRSGAVQDAVDYRESGAWPAYADGLGGTLQRVDPLGPSGSPGNWRCSPVPAGPAGGEWRSFRLEGFHEGPRIYFYLLGPGEVLIDDLKMEILNGDGTNLIPNGDFSQGFAGWSGTGNHLGSRLDDAGGFGGGPCGRVVSSGKGDGANALRETLPILPPASARCVLSVRVKHVSGESTFVFRSSITNPAKGLFFMEGDALSGSSGGGGIGTPLQANEVGEPIASPTLTLLDTAPARPGPADPVRVRARVEATDAVEVKVIYQVAEGARAEEDLADDGQDPDGVAGDGVWTGMIPPAPDRSLVWFSLRAVARSGATALWPPHRNPAPQVGYYVHSTPPETNEELDLYYIFTPGALNDLSCTEGQDVIGSLVDARGRAHRNVGVKFRGETACGYPKRPMRVEFQKGDLLDGQRDLNFNAGWNDKSMIRERFAFDFFDQAEVAASECRLARVLTNGAQFHGCYFVVEDPSERFLRRTRRDPGGGLYKSRTSLLTADTASLEPRSDGAAERVPQVRTFATELNRLNGQPLVDHLMAGLDVEEVMSEQAVKVIIIDGDSVVKNWLLYLGRHELSGILTEKVNVFPWDLDLSYGQMLLTTDVRNYDVHPLFQTQTYPFHDQGYGGIVNALLQRVPADYFVKAYYGRLWRLLEEKFHPQVLLPRVDRYDALTRTAAQADLTKWARWGARPTDLAYWRNDHRTFIQKRYDFLHAYLTALNPTTLGRRFQYRPAPRLTFTEIHFHPGGGAGDPGEFVEITSREGREVSLAGWEIPLLQFTFPDEAVIGPNATVLVAKDPAALRASGLPEGTPVYGPYPGELLRKGGVLRLRDSGDGGQYFPETIDVVVYDGDSTWLRGAEGTGKSFELVRLDADNDQGKNWRAGWSPGRAAREDASPRADIAAVSFPGAGPLAYLLSGLASRDPDGDPLDYEWELPSGARDRRPVLRLDLPQAGEYRVKLTVRDPFGAEAKAEIALGVTGPRFKRGDATGDGVLDLSDPVSTLEALFLGGPATACFDAADGNDDGEIDLTDAITVLSYQFLGGDPPPPPGPQVCGVDPTADGLGPCQEPAACR